MLGGRRERKHPGEQGRVGRVVSGFQTLTHIVQGFECPLSSSYAYVCSAHCLSELTVPAATPCDKAREQYRQPIVDDPSGLEGHPIAKAAHLLRGRQKRKQGCRHPSDA
eukprot:scaffold121752_cov29-Tisochrysis_lutea.AAC.16